MKCGDVAHADAIVGAKYLNMIAIQNRKLALGVSKPYAAEAVRELDHYACLRKILTTAIGCPDAIGQAVQAVTSERHPHSSAAILRDCLEECGLIAHLPGHVNSNPHDLDQTPQTVCSADPESLVRTTVCECHESALRSARLNDLAVRDTEQLGAICACGDPYRTVVIGGHSKVCALVLW